MPPLPMRALLVALVGVALLGAPAGAAPDPGQVDRAAERVLDERFQAEPTGYQRKERDVESRGGSQGGTRIRPHGGGGGGGSLGGGGSGAAGAGGALSAIVSMLLWVLIIAGALVLIFYMVRELSRGHRDKVSATEEEAVEEPVAAEAELDRPLEDADALAQQGRFAEAIHTLLLRTFQELAKASSAKVAPHLTSREILAHIPMLGDGRDALGELVAVVELTWFGDDVPGEADWLRCRAQFDRFVTIHRALSQGARPPGAVAA